MRLKAIFISALGSILVMAPLLAAAATEACLMCHTKQNAGLVLEWKQSKHAKNGLGCLICHEGKEGDPASWKHKGAWVSAIVTPKTCGKCHEAETDEFSRSHHAKAGEILASLDNVLAEKVAGLPDNNADAVNGCWQCHGTIVKFKKNPDGSPMRVGPEQKPVIDPTTWPNSGIGRLNHDGSKGSCNACHSRHAFEAKLARNPKNCGKCHMGPDHPQIEIYNESKHGIAFRASRDRMGLDKDEWILGKDYSAAPTCATCHISGHMGPNGMVKGGTHDVGERISWTLRPVISVKLNNVAYTDGFKEDYPHTRDLPKVGEKVMTVEKVVENDILASKKVERTVAKITPWEERRGKMQAVCANCHGPSFIDGFYRQFDSLVDLYNDKFAKPAKEIMDELKADGILSAKAPFEHKVQWDFWELWHHEGRRARHGASMMGPDYTHWHGMYEVSKHYYLNFLPNAVKAAKEKSPELGKKWQAKVDDLMARPEHLWQKGLSKEEIERLKKEYEERYNQ
ncbi:MAG: hypothetical protein AUJ52_05050 [Elusimicrobia bacterium CG1_02_63_36]|nr:MAG: hypothetical protein AUJ52_05050 [Elusimicrobia bacterium CG1_02_63_36]PIP83330.1 MAG: hypothetical protein COR54_10210 [Elusimicrobia bacterium CG22_combo_CG10-13_8_21_14_all_63_91]PJA17967.1 MAG: hypothetical protein COX66_02825 [Elusimicrobia bacterium CG_4_10_14_0_2_um_filter_63_34]